MTLSQPQLFINQLSYAPSNGKPLFHSLTLTLGNEKTGLIGRNGVGKSTLIQLIMNERKPDKGSIQRWGTLAYCPQQTGPLESGTVADLLGIRLTLAALSRIAQGGMDEADFQLIGDNWMLEEQTRQQLIPFGLQHLAFDQAVATLSGGEITRLRLARAFLAQADFLILDEPTNNLDRGARQQLYHALAQWDKGLLLVSHDRVLLNLLDQIAELTPQGIHLYGGDFEHYQAQKSLMKEAAQKEVLDAKKALANTRASIQSTTEKQAQRQARGKSLRSSGSQASIILDKMKDSSGRSQGALVTRHTHMLKKAETKLHTAKEKIERQETMMLSLSQTRIANGKVILDMENVSFAYAQKHVIKNLHLKIIGPERIAFIGDNGSGKTTLIKLILGELTPDVGSIYRGTERLRYLDQHAGTLDPSLSLLDNFLHLNTDAKPLNAYAALAAFLFKNTAALKRVSELSGGEKLRAELACALMATEPPQLLILDEPTNHLDMESIASIESALQQYEGALIVCSHDETFLQQIGIEKYIDAPFIYPERG